MALSAFLKVGRPEKGMPPFPTLSPADVAALSAFLRAQAAERTPTAATEVDGASMLVGDARAGQAFFVGAGGCTACHSANGDMAAAARRHDPRALQNRLLLNRTRSFDLDEPPTKTVHLTWPDGRTVAAPLLRISDFKVVYRDADGARRTVGRVGKVPTVVVTDSMHAHLDLVYRYSDKQIHDMTAYLVSLK